MRKLLIAGALACMAAPALAQTESAGAPSDVPPPPETCGTLAVGEETSSFSPLEGYSILTSTPPLTRPPGDVDAILCLRSNIYLGPNDHRVITDLQMPFFIRDAQRLAVLEPVDGRLNLRFVQGGPTPAEAQALSGALDRAHEEIAAGR